MTETLDLSVTVCTLNEANNIGPCLDALLAQNPAEIIVIDADSHDDTRAIAESKGARVINAGRKGLANQRKEGVDAARHTYIAVIDADHRPRPGAFATLIEELEALGYDGIEAQILSVSNKGYWDWAMEQNFRLTHNHPGPRIMIGTPCIYRAEVLKAVNYDPFFTGPADDTDLCYRMCQAGHKLGVGTATVEQEHRATFTASRKKWFWYGKGDAQFVWKHRERLASILKHQLYNYPIKKSAIALVHGKPATIPFFVLFGWFRHLGFLVEIVKLLAGKKEDKDIYGT